VVACSGCGEYPAGLSFGKRDWIESPDALTADELDARVRKVKGGSMRATTFSGAGGLDDDTATAAPAWALDATRVTPSSEPVPCPACAEELPITRRDIASAHTRLVAKDIRWLHGYVTMKETVVCGLRHDGIGFRGDLGMFVAAGTQPVFVPSQKLLDLVDKKLLPPKKLLAALAGHTPCRAGGATLPLPTGFGGPSHTLDVELGIGLAEIAKSLRDRGKTPLRGVGTLRTVSYQWGTDHGRLLYMDFDVRVRDVIARHRAGDV
jgi:hypothetical protein